MKKKKIVLLIISILILLLIMFKFEALGEIASKYCDEIIIKEQLDLRGRHKGETAELLKEGALNNGYDIKKIKVILNEGDAVLYSLNNKQLWQHIYSLRSFTKRSTNRWSNDWRKISAPAVR